MHLGKQLCDKKIDNLMSDGNKALKLSGQHTDFNLNLKTVLSPLFDAQKAIYTKKAVPETFDFLVSFFRCDISVRDEIQEDKRKEITS